MLDNVQPAHLAHVLRNGGFYTRAASNRGNTIHKSDELTQHLS